MVPFYFYADEQMVEWWKKMVRGLTAAKFFLTMLL
jgi:hypothetical protein